MTEWLHFHFSLSCIGEGNGNPLPCSCLENPRDGGAWRAAAYGVAQSRTQLQRLSSSSSSIRHFVTQWTVAHQAPLSMGFPRQEYCSGLPYPSPGDLRDPGIECALAGRVFTTEPPGTRSIFYKKDFFFLMSSTFKVFKVHFLFFLWILWIFHLYTYLYP